MDVKEEWYGEKKITNHQLFSLTANGGISGFAIVISALMASIAKQDAWIAALLTSIFGMFVIWIYWFLGSRHPGMTFVGITKKIFGKWIGFIIWNRNNSPCFRVVYIYCFVFISSGNDSCFAKVFISEDRKKYSDFYE